MSLVQAQQRIAQQLGPVRPDRTGERLLASRDVLEKLRSSLPPHQTFWEYPSHALVYLGAPVMAEPSGAVVQAARPARWRELAWLRSNPEEVERHRNQWVAVEPEGIVASSATAAGLAQKARALGLKKPFVLWLPEPDSGALLT